MPVLRNRSSRPRYAESDDDVYYYDEDFDSGSSSSDEVAAAPPVAATISHDVIMNEPTIEFNASELHQHLVCFFCGGFFREPYTTTKCRHTFCHSCLCLAIEAGKTNCAKCDTYLGRDLSKFAQPDRMLQDVMDKILFPGVAAKDAEKERQFYEKREIAVKESIEMEREQRKRSPASRGEYLQGSVAKNNRGGVLREELTFEMVPHPSNRTLSDSDSVGEDPTALPALELPTLRTHGSVRVKQLKKYIILKLELGDTFPHQIELLCHGTPLGDELSISFIKRTVWRESHTNLRLTYRLVK